MEAIGNFLAMCVWCVLFGVICVAVIAVFLMLLSGVVHLVAYLNKQSRKIEHAR